MLSQEFLEISRRGLGLVEGCADSGRGRDRFTSCLGQQVHDAILRGIHGIDTRRTLQDDQVLLGGLQARRILRAVPFVAELAKQVLIGCSSGR